MGHMASEVPVLDCSKIAGPYESLGRSKGFPEFMKELGDAMSGVGFVYLVNHGLDPKIVENVLADSRKFFELPKETKMKYRKSDPLENFNGYTPPEDENVNELNKSEADYKEAWDCWGPDMFNAKGFPTEVAELKDSVNTFRQSLVLLCKKLFFCFGKYLNLEDPEFFLKRHRALEDPSVLSHNVVRTNYYMPLKSLDGISENTMRLGEHNDWGSVTFLIQDSAGGLEAKRTDGTWVQVPPIDNSIVLNAGLMLEMWSGGHFPATGHRVRLVKEKALSLRQSIGFFVQPDGDSNCIPLVPEKPTWEPLYPKVDKETHFEYFKDRIRGSRAY